MTLKDEYARTAERSLQSGRHLEVIGVQESVGFYAYHAFESIGSALIASRHQKVPRRHRAKIRAFAALARGRRYRMPLAQLAIELEGLRNQFLYPEQQPDGRIQRPEDVLTIRQVGKLISRVGGIVKRVHRDL